MSKFRFILALGFAFLPQLLSAAPLTIENESLRVTYNEWSREFDLAPLPEGKILVSGDLPILGKAEKTEAGVIKISGDDGRTFYLSTPGIQPFVLISETIENLSGQEEALTKDSGVSFTLQSEIPDSNFAVRGTGGLHAATEYAPRSFPWLGAIWDKITRHPYHQPGGSYAWSAVADPQTRHGVVAGYITQNRATGVLTPRYDADKLLVDVHTEFGSLLLKPGQTVEPETLAIGYFDDVRVGLEKYADLIAHTSNNIKLPPQPAGYCTWYAEQHGGSSDEKSLAELTDFIAKNLQPFGLNFVQLDDGWQLGDSHGNGPNKNFTDFNPKGPYPSGMKSIADRIKSNALTPGLWFIPFGGTYNDDWFADKQDLFMKTKDGKPFDTNWGGTCLDMTNPAARDYLKGIVNNVVHNWGFTYLKMDGLHTGLGAKQIYINSDYNDDHWGGAALHDPSKTYIEAFRSGVQLIRDVAGPNVFLLGCNTAQNMRVYGASFGLVDAMRIGPDNAGTWKAWSEASPVYGSRHYFLNGRVWYNDPDPCYVRTALTLDEARTTASWTSISGQLYTNSDWLPDLPPERLDIIKRTIAPHGKTARPVDFLENDPPRIWQVIDDKGPVRRDVVALFNWSDKEEKIDLPLWRLGGPFKPPAISLGMFDIAAFDFWGNQFLPHITFTSGISATLPPHGCKIIALRIERDRPVVLSTSAHVTQGMTDILEEHWDADSHTLTGKSRVVGGDPYEMRIATPDPNQHCKIFQAGLDDFHDPNGVTIDTSGDKENRARFTAAKTGIVSWSFVF